MGEVNKCSQCSRSFTSQTKLDAHLATDHQQYGGQEALIEKCTVAIWNALNSNGDDPVPNTKAKIALGYLGVVAKREQTASAREATSFMMARELAADKDQLEKYVRATMPSSRILAALPAKKD